MADCSKLDCNIRNITVEQKDAIFAMFEDRGWAIEAEVSPSGRTIYAIGDCARSSAKYKSCDGGSGSPLQENTVSVVLDFVR